MYKIVVSATLIFPLLAGGALAAPTYGMPGYGPPSYRPLPAPSYRALAEPGYSWQGTMPEECFGTTPDWGHCLNDNDRQDRTKTGTAGNGGKGMHG